MSAMRYFKDEIRKGIDPKASKPKIKHNQRDLIELAPV